MTPHAPPRAARRRTPPRGPWARVARGALPAIGLLAACSSPPKAPPDTSPYSEEREPCAERDPLRKPYFGDLHVHTTYSFDAWTYDVRTTPADAYRFARGEPIHLPPLGPDGKGTTEVQLDRPLDFAAVTDHAEYLGEVSLCTTPGSPAYDTATCAAYRPPTSSFLGFGVGAAKPVRADFCQDNTLCTDAALPVWQATRDAAEEAYDRTSSCRFTTFVAYEYSLSPLAANLHRNVIFRNAVTLPSPITTYDAPTPEELWEQLDQRCRRADNGCDVLAIPHNSNLSNGRMFEVETPKGATIEDERRAAELRAAMEPVAEIYQHKGDSECLSGLGPAIGAPDEQCLFEKQHAPPYKDCGDGTGNGGLGGFGCVSWRDHLRGGLETGLLESERLGVNPYKLGFIGSTDTHNGTPGAVEEASYRGHLGLADQSPELALGATALAGTPVYSSPGGLAGVWAEENSRDALFDAILRRETFATSGPRIVVRLFAGWSLPGDLCGRADLVEQGYALGVPMGADLPPRAQPTSPTIVLSALRDAGTEARPGALLQRAQIIKLWIDAAGTPHEAVYDVAGAPQGGGVDPSTCEPQGPGADSLCAVWTDPDFDPARPATYYGRVLENPTCRWSTHLCNSLSPEKRAELACDALPVPSTLQERAWTSPVWYEP